MEKRDYRIDNAKCILIYLVVLGHLLEQVPGTAAGMLYRTIYLYHMPLFVFITGLFASRRSRGSDWRMIWLYVVFQTVYQLFDAAIQQKSLPALQYTQPYWLLWYLLCTIMYRLTVPLIDEDRPARQLAVLLAAAAVSLLAGFEKTVGYYLTLSRFFTFYPFFLLGYYAQKDRAAIERLFRKSKWVSRGVPCACCLAVAGSICWLYVEHVSYGALYGSMSYSTAGYTAGMKALMLLFGVCGIGLLPLVWKDRLPVVTQLGRNSLAIFLLHGFIIKCISRFGGGISLLGLRKPAAGGCHGSGCPSSAGQPVDGGGRGLYRPEEKSGTNGTAAPAPAKNQMMKKLSGHWPESFFDVSAAKGKLSGPAR